MKKITTSIILLFMISVNGMFAQIVDTSETKKDGNAKITLKEQATFDRIQKVMSKYGTHEAGMREVTRHLDMSKAETGFLYDLVYPVAKLDAFNEKLNVSSNIHFRQAWQEILRAKINGKAKVDNPEFLRFDYMATQKNEFELGLICGQINTFDREAYGKGVLEEKAGFLYSKGDPFKTKPILIMSPLRDVVQMNKDGMVYFSFGSAILSVSKNKLKSLTVSFENLDEINLISKGEVVTKDFGVSFKESGNYLGKVKGEFLNGETMNTEFDLVVKFPPPPPSADAYGCISDDKDVDAELGFNPFAVYGTDFCFDCNGAAEYRIYYGNFDCQLKKPILITDGIDFGDQRDLDSIIIQ